LSTAGALREGYVRQYRSPTEDDGLKGLGD